MADDKTKTAPQDSSRVNIHEDYEVRYWCQRFNCTSEELKTAVNKVGVASAAVEQELGKRMNAGG